MVMQRRKRSSSIFAHYHAWLMMCTIWVHYPVCRMIVISCMQLLDNTLVIQDVWVLTLFENNLAKYDSDVVEQQNLQLFNGNTRLII